MKTIDEGKDPSKEFPCKLRYSKLKQFPMELGISPNKLFSEISSWLIFFRLPTSKGSLPVNELLDKLSSIVREDRPISCGG